LHIATTSFVLQQLCYLPVLTKFNEMKKNPRCILQHLRLWAMWAQLLEINKEKYSPASGTENET